VSLTRRWQVLAGVALLFAVSASLFGHADFVPERSSLEYFPREVAGYKGRDIPVSNAALRQLELTDYLSREYKRDGRQINVYVGFHGNQGRRSLIHSPQHCLPANGWYIAGHERVPLPGGAPGTRVNRLEAAYGKQEALIYYWYQGRGRTVPGEIQAALLRALDAAMLSRTDEALVRFITTGNGDGAEEDLRAFIQAFLPLLPRYIPE
jgi:EpsI family protein